MTGTVALNRVWAVYTDLLLTLNRRRTQWQIVNGEMVFRRISEALYPGSELEGVVTAQARIVTFVNAGLFGQLTDKHPLPSSFACTS